MTTAIPPSIKPENFATVVALDLNLVEHTIDQLNIQLSGLLQTMASGRVAAGYSAVLGQQAFEQVSEAIRATNHVRGHVVAAHRGLERNAQRLNVTYAGPLEDKGDAPERPPVTGRLMDDPMMPSLEAA
jgi:hypothetical protein